MKLTSTSRRAYIKEVVILYCPISYLFSKLGFSSFVGLELVTHIALCVFIFP